MPRAEARLTPANSLPADTGTGGGPGGPQEMTAPDPLGGVMLTQDASRLQYPVELLRVRTFTKEGKPWEEGYLLREEMAAFKSPVEVREKVLVEKPEQALEVYFKEAYLGSYTMEELLKLRTYGSQLYIGDPNAKDACVPVMEELNSPTTVLYPRATYYLYDHLGNTRVLMKPVGSNCGNITNYAIEYLADYHPYGQLLRSWQSTSTREKYLSTQHQRDISSGLDYRNARFSDPETGLFYGVDPLASNFPAWSPYAYTMGNPVNLIDPSGMGPEGWSQTNVDLANRFGVFGDGPENGLNEYTITIKDGKVQSCEKTGTRGGDKVDYITIANEDKLFTSEQFTQMEVLVEHSISVSHHEGLPQTERGPGYRNVKVGASGALEVTESPVEYLIGIGLGKALVSLMGRKGVHVVAETTTQQSLRTVKSLTEQAVDLVKLNGKNSVTIGTPTKQIRFDLAGKAHGNVPTPNMQVYNKIFVDGVQKRVYRASK